METETGHSSLAGWHITLIFNGQGGVVRVVFDDSFYGIGIKSHTYS